MLTPNALSTPAPTEPFAVLLYVDVNVMKRATKRTLHRLVVDHPSCGLSGSRAANAPISTAPASTPACSFSVTACVPSYLTSAADMVGEELVEARRGEARVDRRCRGSAVGGGRRRARGGRRRESRCGREERKVDRATGEVAAMAERTRAKKS